MHTTLTGSAVRLDLDLAAPGKHFGRIAIPFSTNVSAWGELRLPTVVINRGDGPTVLLLGGNHGDEYEGQLLLLRLVEQIDAADVTGRVIVVPGLSPAASAAGSRLWPDGSNFNRSFPGSPEGSVAEQLADFLTRQLFPACDVVCDLHSGGRSLLFAPMAAVHLVDDLAQRREMLELSLSWMTDLCLVHGNAGFSGLLPDQAESMGKLVSTTELGGGGTTTAETLSIGERGLHNMLRQVGVLNGEVRTRASLGLAPTRFVRALGGSDYLRADEPGLFEPLVAPGDPVTPGQLVGRIRFLEHPDRAPLDVRAETMGFVVAVRSLPRTDIGDCFVVVGQEVRREEVE